MKKSAQIPMPLVLGLVLVLATQLVSCQKGHMVSVTIYGSGRVSPHQMAVVV